MANSGFKCDTSKEKEERQKRLSVSFLAVPLGSSESLSDGRNAHEVALRVKVRVASLSRQARDITRPQGLLMHGVA